MQETRDEEWQQRQARQVERAVAELRRGDPVMLMSGNEADALAVLAVEAASKTQVARCHKRLGTDAFVLLTPERAQDLKIGHKGRAAVAVAWPAWLDLGGLAAIADPVRDLATPLKGPLTRLELPVSAAMSAGLQLAKLAQMLPALMAWPVAGEAAALARDADMLTVDAAAVMGHELATAAALVPVVSARVPLAVAEDARIYAFRPEVGAAEHLAIVIGDPPRHEPVLARLHSECLTGDLLGSLKCDCGDQLRGALAAIAAAGGGVLLYLAQEGRGIGLMNKLRAYALQDQGFDTIDANTKLGFRADERQFAPAAAMLRGLGFSRIRLMTNNPEKLAGLQQAGLECVERVPHQFPSNAHNEGYLATKKARAGHLLK